MSVENKLSAVSLNPNGYDPFIDFMKGCCIIAVVLQHALYIPGQQYLI